MATKLYSDAELDRMRRFPDAIAADELIRFFTLMPGDLAFVNGHRGESSRIGAAVQLCTLPWLGFVPDDVTAAPDAAVARLGGQLGIGIPALRKYGVREQTRTDHLRDVAAFLGWRVGGEVEFKELDQVLVRDPGEQRPGVRVPGQNTRSIPPWRNTAMSSMLSAPATIPPGQRRNLQPRVRALVGRHRQQLISQPRKTRVTRQLHHRHQPRRRHQIRVIEPR